MKIQRQMLYCAVAALAFSSCVTDGYENLKAPIDKEMTVLGSLDLPVGKTDQITIGELLDFGDSGIIGTDEAGNYVFSIDVPASSSSFSLDPVTMGKSTQFTESFVFKTGGFTVVPGIVGELEQELKNLKVPFSFEYDGIPEEVKSIESLDVDSAIDIVLSYRADGISAISMNKGWVISVPDSYVISKVESDDFDVVKGTNNIVSNKDIRLNSGKQISLKVIVSRINLNAKDLGSKHSFAYSSDFEVGGKVTLNTSDVTASVLPDVQINVAASMSSIKVSSITGMIKASAISMDGISHDVEDIPETFQDAVLDLKGSGIVLKPSNELPWAVKVSFMLGSIDSEGKAVRVKVDDIVIEPGDTREIFISEDGSMAPKNARKVNVSGFDKIFHAIPSKIMIDDMTVDSIIDEPVTIKLGNKFNVGVEYGKVIIPLLFGDDMTLDYEQDIELSLGEVPGGLNTLALAASITSSLPFDLAISAQALDENGQKINSISSDIDGIIMGGSIQAPKTSPIEVTLKLGDSDLAKVKAIRFNLHAEMSVEGNSASLNEGQYIKFNQITARIRDGFSLNLDK